MQRLNKRAIRGGKHKCIYCGVRDSTDVEHVIPASFFGPPTPGEIPKVPACAECNQLKGDGGTRNMNIDETYMRDRLCMMMAAQHHPDVVAIREAKAIRNLLRPEMDREREELLESANDALIVNGVVIASYWSFFDGFRFANASSFAVDIYRINRVLAKFARGLYYHHYGQRIPDAWYMDVAPRIPIDVYESYRAAEAAQQHLSPIYTISPYGGLKYQFVERTQPTARVVVLMGFYHAHTCLVCFSAEPIEEPTDL